MGSKERREREKASTRALILDAARELFVTEGYDGVSMRKIADRIEYSPTAIYVHFADKDALLTELSVCDFEAFTSRLIGVPDNADPTAQLRWLARAYVRFAVEHPAAYRHLFLTERTVSPEALARKPKVDAYDILLTVVTAAQRAGVFHPDWSDPHEIGQALWAAMHGVVSLHLFKARKEHMVEVGVEQLVETMCSRLLLGFAAPRALCCDATTGT